MLRINGKSIGDSVELTLTRSNLLWYAEEKINGLPVFPVNPTNTPMRIGDRVIASIVAKDSTDLFYHVRIERFVDRGNGKSTDRQQLAEQLESLTGPDKYRMQLLVIQSLLWRYKTSIVVEIMLDVLEKYKLDSGRKLAPLDYSVVGEQIKELIATLPSRTNDEKVELLLRAVDYCSAREEGMDIAYALAQEATRYLDADRKWQLLAWAELGRLTPHHTRKLEAELAEKEAKDGAQSMMRIQLALCQLVAVNRKYACAAVHTIEPVYDELRQTPYFEVVAHILLNAFITLGCNDQSTFWGQKRRKDWSVAPTAFEHAMEVVMRMTPLP